MHKNSCTNTYTYTRVRVCACSGCAQVCMDVSYGCLPHNEKGLIYDIQVMSFFQKLSSTSLIHTQEKDLHAAAKTPGRRVKRWQFVLHHVCVLSEHACMQTTKGRYVHVVVYIPSPITPYHPSPRRQCLVNVKHYARVFESEKKWKKTLVRESFVWESFVWGGYTVLYKWGRRVLLFVQATVL